MNGKVNGNLDSWLKGVASIVAGGLILAAILGGIALSSQVSSIATSVEAIKAQLVAIDARLHRLEQDR